ncbi:MAG TPA: sigma 54-interacting transcriptional regulator [Bacillota bacterium]|nr:sigma 54-interacting transcriptional regulator [Bacillota bacterium]
MNIREYEELLKQMTGIIKEAVHVVDAGGRSIIYNQAMANLEETRREEVLGTLFADTFSNIPKEESTMLKALRHGKATMNKQQTYLNKYGKEITTVNSTVPVTVDGKIVAAVEIARDITDIKKMSNTILELQEESIKPKKTEYPGIKHYNFADIIGEDPEFVKLVDSAKKASHNKASVFIYGETGTGKELFAQSIHYEGSRKTGPFLAQNCAALPASLLEGILFGTSKGGFTGAVDRAGLFEQASGGTLLLDEISAMPYDLQSKLLRVLQEDYIRRLGGMKDVPVDVRIIATVNEKPEILIEKGALRKDLYYRLGIVNLDLPPLRERKGDIPVLAHELLEKQSRRFKKKVSGFSEEAMTKLQSHDYPGNIRELENIIMAAVSMADEESLLDAEHIILPAALYPKSGKKDTVSYNSGIEKMKGISLSGHLDIIEKELISEAMEKTEGNISRAADMLGISRQLLQHKLKK